MARLGIGLLWHGDSSGNLGVGALTSGDIELVRRAAARAGAEPEFHLFRPADTGAKARHPAIAHRHDITGRFMASPGGYWRALDAIDLMLDIGAGDSFADIYPDKRFAYIIATKLMCRWKGVPLVLAPQTIGPFSRQPHGWLAARALNAAEAVFARDPLSFEAVGRLAPGARRFQAIDVAFALPYTPAKKGPGTRVGVNVSGLLFAGGYGGGNDYGLSYDYAEFTRRLIAGLLATGATVELVAHVRTDIARDDDGAAIDALNAEFPGTVRVPDFASAEEAKSHISGLDFLVAARMHASIAAWSAGVPVLPVSYSRKFEGLYQALGYPALIPPRGLSTEAAVAQALDWYERRDELAAAIEAGRPAVEAGLAAYEDWLADRLRALAAR
ncbi:MAG: polysaccharide pyruvyl transferase family protein [Sphingomonadaceae bacterium]